MEMKKIMLMFLVSAAISIAGMSAAAMRSVSTLDVLVGEDGSAKAEVAFSEGVEGDSHVLYYVWSNDGIDKGADISDWPNVLRVNRVSDGAQTAYVFDLPQAAVVTPLYAARVFLASSGKDYDYLVESVYASAATSCFLDTGFFPVGGKTCLTMDVKVANSNTAAKQYYLFGVNNSSYAFCGYINNSGKWAFACNNGSGKWDYPTSMYASKTDRVRVTLDATASPIVFTVESPGATVVKTSTEKNTASATAKLYLFGRNAKAAGENDKDCAATCYSCSITNDNVCVRDYLPAIKGGVPGLYDRVNNVFCSSSGSKAFTSSATNVTYFVEEGDQTVAASPVWKNLSGEFFVSKPFVESGDLVFDAGGAKLGSAPLTLLGKNDFGGVFTVKEGTLVADFGQGLAEGDSLLLDGGAYCPYTSQMLVGPFGDGSGISYAEGATAAGFSAYGHPLTVTLADGSPFVCGTSGFSVPRLILNDDYATDTLTLKNALVGGNADETLPELELYTGAADVVIEGSVTGLSIAKRGGGTLCLAAATNAVGRLAPDTGRLVLAPPAGERGSLSVNQIYTTAAASGELVVSNAVVTQNGAGTILWYGKTKVSFVDCDVKSSGEWYPGNRSGANGSGYGETGSLVLDGSSLAIGNDFVLGYYSYSEKNCKGEMIVTNDATFSCSTFNARYGSVKQYGGHVKATYGGGAGLRIGTGDGYSTFDYHLYGGILEHSSTAQNSTFSIGFYDGDHPTGTLCVYPGGQFISRGRNGYIGRYANNTGKILVKGGIAQMTYSGAPLYVGYLGNGRLEVCDGGRVDVNGNIVIVNSSSSAKGRTGVLEIQTNGTVSARSVYSACTNDTARLVFDGGTLVARSGAREPFVSGLTTAAVGIGGGTIDTAGFNITVAQSFSERSDIEQTWEMASTAAAFASAPAFTKAGEGTLVLLGTNMYLCATCVSNGTLVAACEESLPVTTALRLGPSGKVDLAGKSHTVAHLGGAGMVENGSLSVTGTVWPGLGGGALKIAADASLLLKKLSYEVAADGSCGRLEVAGNLDLTGVELEIDNPTAAKRSQTLISATTITGLPKSNLTGRYMLRVSGGMVRFAPAAFQIVIQ